MAVNESGRRRACLVRRSGGKTSIPEQIRCLPESLSPLIHAPYAASDERVVPRRHRCGGRAVRCRSRSLALRTRTGRLDNWKSGPRCNGRGGKLSGCARDRGPLRGKRSACGVERDDCHIPVGVELSLGGKRPHGARAASLLVLLLVTLQSAPALPFPPASRHRNHGFPSTHRSSLPLFPPPHRHSSSGPSH